MKIVFNTHLAVDFPERLASFASTYPHHEFVTVSGKAGLLAEITGADVLVDHRINADILDAAPNLQWIFIPFTGVDFLPWDLLAERRIRVSNNHGNASIVAERAVALALAAMGRIAEFDRGMRRGYWHRRDSRGEPFILWTSLRDARVAILGTGAIGSEIARLISPFTDNVVGFRRRPAETPVGNFRQVTDDIRTALKGALVCFVALPLTTETDGLLGDRELALLANGFLVNISRGEVVSEKPLYEALAGGRLAGAGLDVWYRYPEPFAAECMPSEYPFHELDNVVLSPHSGSHAPEGKLGQLEGTLENLAALIETGEPRDIADPSVGY